MPVLVTVEKAGSHKFLRWHIARPERLNAIGPTIVKELSEALNSVKMDPVQGVRALVISAETVSTNDRRIWVAGGDLRELSDFATKDEALVYAKSMHSICRDLELLPVPVFSFVDGAAIGGGAELALAADIRFGTPESSFEWKQLAIGLATGYGAASRLCQLVGKARAQRLLYFCESISHSQALDIGVLHRVVEDFEGLRKAVANIAKLDPLALATQKRMFHLATTSSGGDSTWADDLFKDLWRNPSHAKALEDFQVRTSS